MRLSDYLKQHQIMQVEFADVIGVSPQSVERYVNGKRIPKPKIIQKIKEKTKGAVTANDFYDRDEKCAKNLTTHTAVYVP